MANQLVSLFEDFKLENVPTKHVVEIKYQVRGLLPPDTNALLITPVEIGTREAPSHDQRKSGVFQSTCRIHIPIEERDNARDSFPEDELVPQFSAF